MQSAIFSCNILQSKGKYGKLKTDENGYREICLGAFDAYNDVGDLYAFTPNVLKVLGSGSDFHRRISKGALYGELGHPKRMPGESAEDFLQRALDVAIGNRAHHIKTVKLIDGKDHKGRKIKLAMGQIKGAGPHGDALEASLSNPDENVAFSIRCLTRPIRLPGNVIAKELYHAITWDQVIEGGIDVANKYDTPSMESAKIDLTITPEMLDNIEKSKSGVVDMESLKDQISMVRTNLGWQKVQVIPTHSATNWK